MSYGWQESQIISQIRVAVDGGLVFRAAGDVGQRALESRACQSQRVRSSERGNGADSSGLAFVVGKARVAPRLRAVNAGPISAQVNSRTVTLYVSVPRSTLPSPAEIRFACPVRVCRCSCLGREDVDAVLVRLVREVHRRGDMLPPAFAAAVMQEDHGGALKGSANLALVGTELRDGLAFQSSGSLVSKLLSFRGPGAARELDGERADPPAAPELTTVSPSLGWTACTAPRGRFR